MAEHGQRRDQDGQRQRPPESALEVRQLGTLALLEAGHFRLERHSAFRTGTRMVLANLGVHRARVDRAGHRLLGDWRRHQAAGGLCVLRGVGCELRLAARAAEVHRLAFVLEYVR